MRTTYFMDDPHFQLDKAEGADGLSPSARAVRREFAAHERQLEERHPQDRLRLR